MGTAAVPSTAEQLRDWLRELKEQSGLSFADLARATGEEERNIKRWMTVEGEPVVPRGDSLLRLLAALGVTFSVAPPGSVSAVNEELRRMRTVLVHSVFRSSVDRRVVELVAAGQSNAQIGASLGLTEAEVVDVLRRAETVLRSEAGEAAVDPVQRRLEELAAKVAELPTAQDIRDALDAVLERLPPVAAEGTSAGRRASSRKRAR